MFGDKKYGSSQNAITVWKDHMVSQGFGYRLGTDLPGEQRGLIPNAQFYDKAYKGSWNGLTVIATRQNSSADGDKYCHRARRNFSYAVANS